MEPSEIFLAVELAALAALYLAGLARLPRARADAVPRTLAFCTGLALLGVALIALERPADSSLPAHMVQHLLLLFVVPPLLLAGAPHRVALGAAPALRQPLARILRSWPLRALTHPAAALAAFALILIAWHLPSAYDAAAAGGALHGLEHACFLLAGLLLWLPLLGAPPRPHRLSPLAGVLYLMVAMLPGALIGLRLISAGEPIYSHYAELGSALAAQHEAGMLMVGAGGLLLAAAAVGFGWAAVEREERARVARTTTMIVAAIGAVAIGAAQSERSSAQAQRAIVVGVDEEVERGRALFEQGCSDCHGPDARGIAGRGPTLFGAGEAAADFYLRTGRMPLDDPDEQPERAESPYEEEEIAALVAYVGTLGEGPPIPAVDAEDGDLAEGRELFSELCAGCHQIVGQGGITTQGVVPDLDRSEPIDVAEAIEIGPYVMPAFRRLESAEVDAIARFVGHVQDPEDRGGWGIGHIGPIPEGMIAWLLAGVALLLAIRLIGERTTR